MNRPKDSRFSSFKIPELLYNLLILLNIGWGTWIRTRECRYQKPVPYRLAIPQRKICSQPLLHLIAIPVNVRNI